MKRVLISVVAFALLVAACGGTERDGVASLEATETTVAQEAASDAAVSDEDTLLEFSAHTIEGESRRFPIKSQRLVSCSQSALRASLSNVLR